MTIPWKNIQRVVDSGNCTGCGLCASQVSGVAMELSNNGFMRPVRTGHGSQGLEEKGAGFASYCPGISVRRPEPGEGQEHEIFGRYLKVWSAAAIDDDIREAGSSGGVLTAIADRQSRMTGRGVLGAAGSQGTRTVPVEITDRESALRAAGSRYAPFAALERDRDHVSAVIGKPCEAAGLAALEGDASPLILSFFCAGTPSQHATEALVERSGIDPSDVTSLRYRGNGWPGRFRAKTEDGREASYTYEESWGDVLGRQLQSRCKVCVDGTGEAADIAVGDYWESDDAGFPVFDDGDGRSVIIARTRRGLQTVLDCLADGTIEGTEIDIDALRSVQPYQVRRRTDLYGRILGRRLSGRTSPNYGTYRLRELSSRNMKTSFRALLGTVRREIKGRNTHADIR